MEKKFYMYNIICNIHSWFCISDWLRIIRTVLRGRWGRRPWPARWGGPWVAGWPGSARPSWPCSPPRSWSGTRSCPAPGSDQWSQPRMRNNAEDNVVVSCTRVHCCTLWTHINVPDVSEPHVLHIRLDVSEVPDVDLDHSGDVHALYQHVQDNVGHGQLKPESTNLENKGASVMSNTPNLLSLTWPFAPDLKVMLVSMIEVSMVKIGLPESSE